MEKLLEYLNSLSKDARSQFVENCNTSEGYLRKAISMKQRLGSDLCILIDRESNGAVPCECLRSDVDWAYLRTSTPETAPTRRATGALIPGAPIDGKKVREAKGGVRKVQTDTRKVRV